MKTLHYNLIIVFALILSGGLSFLSSRYLPPLFSRDNSSSAVGKESLTVKDGLGRDITVTLPVKRVVSVYSAMTETLNSIGAGELVVGTTSSYAKKLGIRGVGSHIKPDIEAILSCDPDLVILSASRPDTVTKIEETLSKENITVLAIKPKTVVETLQNIELFEKLTGCFRNKSEVELQIEQMKRVEEFLKDISKEERPKVFLEVRALPLLTCGKDSLPYDVIIQAGGIPAFSDSGSVNPIDIEKLVDASPDFYIQQKGIMNKKPISLKEHNVMSKLKCVLNNRSATIDEKLISRPGPRVIEAVIEVHKLLYPDSTSK